MSDLTELVLQGDFSMRTVLAKSRVQMSWKEVLKRKSGFHSEELLKAQFK